MFAKGPGLSGKSRMPQSMPPMPQGEMSDDDDQDGDEDQNHSSKLMALGDILNNIHEISDNDLKPYVEEARKNLMAANPMQKDMPGMGMHDDSENDENMPMPPPKSGLDVTIGMGDKPPKGMMSEDNEDNEDEEGMPKKGGFMAILAKKIKGK